MWTLRRWKFPTKIASKGFKQLKALFSVSNKWICGLLKVPLTVWNLLKHFFGNFQPLKVHIFSPPFDKKIPKFPWLDGISELAVRRLNPSQDQTAINRLISSSFDKSIINITHLHTMLSKLYLALLHSQHVNNNIGDKISDRCPKWKKSTGLHLIKVRTF